MASYVIGDIHGRRRTLERLLERLSPADDDELYFVGDMVDRGPDPVGVMKLVHELAPERTIMGNHEQMMVESLLYGDAGWAIDWSNNGNSSTTRGLYELPTEASYDLLDWVANLPLYRCPEVAGRRFLVVHAGIDVTRTESLVPKQWDDEGCAAYLNEQRIDDLLWIRESFWKRATGLITAEGEGPIVVCGHTPTILIGELLGSKAGTVLSPANKMLIAKLGAGKKTGGVPDRIGIDCGAGTGSIMGQLCALNLETLEPVYETVLDKD